MKNNLPAILIILIAAFVVSLLFSNFLSGSGVNLGAIFGNIVSNIFSTTQGRYGYTPSSTPTASTPGGSTIPGTNQVYYQCCGICGAFNCADCTAACQRVYGTSSATQAGPYPTGDCGGTTRPSGDYCCYRIGSSDSWSWQNCGGSSNAEGGGSGTTPTCTCSEWNNTDCGISPCQQGEILQTRTCNPSGCLAESQCVASEACTYYIAKGGPNKDSTIQQDQADTNYGSSQNMLVISKSDANWRLLVRFGTSLIPPGAIVKKAILILTYNSIVEQDPVNRNYTAHEILQTWNENEVTWKNATKGKAWDNAGGDFGGLVTSTLVPSSAGVNVSWRIDSLAQKWIDTPENNSGILIKDNNEGSSSAFGARFSTKESSYSPSLEIDFTLPDVNCCCQDLVCGQNCAKTYLTCDRVGKNTCPATSCTPPSTTTTTTSSTTTTATTSSTTTTTSTPTFSGSNFACTAITGGFSCALDCNNNLGENARVVFFFGNSVGDIVESPAPTVNQGSTSTSAAFYCLSHPSGDYFVSWNAYKLSDASLSNRVAWSKNNERLKISC